MESLRNFCLRVSSLGVIGEIFGGTLLATSYGFLCVLFGKFLCWISPTVAYATLGIYLLSAFVVVQLALGAISDKDVSVIMLDKMTGVMLAFLGVSLEFYHWKILVAGFILFHLLLWAEPILFYPSFMQRIKNLPGALGVFSDDVVIAITVNVFIHVGAMFY